MVTKFAATRPVEGPWALPKGWRWERLGNVCRPTEKGSPASRFTGSFRYTDVGGIGEGVEAKVVPVAEAPSRARQFVRPGDTLFSGVRVNLRRTILAKPEMTDVASTAFSVLSPGSEIEPAYLFRWMTSDFLVNSLIPLQRGSQPPAVLDDDVRAQPIAVPPPGIQRSIVARIDELFAEIDDGEAALALVRHDLETWRKALLKAAVTGELTAHRRGHPKGRQNRRTRRFSELVEIKSGFAFKSAEYGQGSIPLIRIADVAGDEVRVSGANARMPDYHLRESASFLVQNGDILLTLSGSVGRSATYRSAEPALLNQRVCRIRCRDDSGLLPDYAQLFLSAMEQVIAAMGYGGSQANVSPKQIADLPIVVPEEDEQLEILQCVDNHMAERDLAAATQALTETSKILRQSILAAAFRGELA